MTFRLTYPYDIHQSALLKPVSQPFAVEYFSTGSVADWCEFWLRDGNSGIHQHLSRPWLSEDHRCSHTSRLVSRQKETAQEKESLERQILEGGLSGNWIFLCEYLILMHVKSSWVSLKFESKLCTIHVRRYSKTWPMKKVPDVC